MPVEIISAKHLITVPRYPGGAPYDARTNWQPEDLTALKVLCDRKADLSKAAQGLGRNPKGMAWHAAATGLAIPREWREAISTYKRKPPQPKQELLVYPFVRSARGEHDILLAVNAMVPRGLPDHIRADVCQEMLLAIYEGNLTIEELQEDPSIVRRYLATFRQANLEGRGYALSLDAPMRDGRSWYDVLPEPQTDEPLHSLEDLAEAFPEIARSGNGQSQKQKARDRAARERVAYLEELRGEKFPEW